MSKARVTLNMQKFYILTLLLVLASCSAGIRLNAKKDPEFERNIQAIYIRVDASNSEDEEFYEGLIAGLKQVLTERGIQVQENFSDDSTDLNSEQVSSREIAFLTIGEKETILYQSSKPIVYPNGTMGTSQQISRKQHLWFTLQDAATAKNVWVAEVYFNSSEKRYLADRIIQGMEADGLIPRISTPR